jgi:hypothetical protein
LFRRAGSTESDGQHCEQHVSAPNHGWLIS